MKWDLFWAFKAINMKPPSCCGGEMKMSMELGRFVEARCGKCGDTVYIKRMSKALPQMIDD